MRRRALDIFRSECDPPAQRYYRSAAPAVPAISLDDAKSFLRVDFDDDDNDIQRFVNAAIGHLDGSGRERDGVLGKAMINQTWILEAERPDRGRIVIEHGPVQTITSVEVMLNNVRTTWDPANYRLGFRDSQAFIAPVVAQCFPQHDLREDAFKITYVAGYGAAQSDLPAGLVEAMLMHVGHLYENRGAVVLDARGQAITVPFGYDDHIAPHRVIPIV